MHKHIVNPVTIVIERYDLYDLVPIVEYLNDLIEIQRGILSRNLYSSLCIL
jgi:hypothetical protein